MSLSSAFNETLEKCRNEVSSLVEQNAREFIRNCPEYFKNYPEWVVETPEYKTCFPQVPLIYKYEKNYSETNYTSISCYIFEDEIRILYACLPLGIHIESIFKISTTTIGIYEKNYSIRLAASHLSHLFSL